VINIREEEGRKEGRRKEWKGRKVESVSWKKRHEAGRRKGEQKG